jgi:hypothetical protein
MRRFVKWLLIGLLLLPFVIYGLYWGINILLWELLS